ncbi:MAG: WG repeat-containing protein [Candidatus Nomurabacteria bacterium]|jgi:hypothetical protein|nr:WG repeat-containing protein [Candidatus Nomurabacteria bacterium]
MDGNIGFRKITRTEYERLTPEQQAQYIAAVKAHHAQNQQRLHELLTAQEQILPKQKPQVAPTIPEQYREVVATHNVAKHEARQETVQHKPVTHQPVTHLAHQPVAHRNRDLSQHIHKTRHGAFSRMMSVSSKKVKIAGVALVLAGVGLFGANMIRNLVLGKSVDSTVAAVMDSEKPVIVRESGKYGYMDIHGQTIIPANYRFAGEFFGNFAEVKTEVEHSIINKKGDVVLEIEQNDAVNIDTDFGMWFIGNKIYDINMKPLDEGEKKELSYKQRGVYTYKNASDKLTVASLEKGNFYSCEQNCTVVISQAPNWIKDTYVLINENSVGEGMTNKIINVKTGKVVFEAKNQLLVAKDKNVVAKSVDGNEVLMYLAGDKVVYESKGSFEVYDQIKHVVKITNTDEKTKAQYPTIYTNVDTNKTEYQSPINSSMLTLVEPSMDVRTCGNNSIGISVNDGAVKCNWSSLATPSYKTMEYLRSKKRLLVVGRSSVGEEFYNVSTGERLEQFDQIAMSDTKDTLFALVKRDGKWFVYSYLTGKYTEAQDAVSTNLSTSALPTGVKTYTSYFTVETKSGTSYYNHNMERFYEVAK